MLGLFRNKTKDIPILEDLLNGDRDRYMARHIILDRIKPLDADGIWCDSTKYVRAVIIGSDSLSLHLVRQLALACHYPNFNDENGSHRTVLTIVDPHSESRDDVEKLKSRLEMITGNLLSECIWRCRCCGAGTVEWSSPRTRSFIDLEFEFVGLGNLDVNLFLDDYLNQAGDSIVSVIDNNDIITQQTSILIEDHCHQYYKVDGNRLDDFITDYRIDVRRAQVVNMLYDAGGHLDDIIASNLYKVSAYKSAIEAFCTHTTEKKRQSSWDSIGDVALKLSSVCCADGLDAKLRCVNAGHTDLKHLNGEELECFARSEHTRWSVEKLIVGYRPYTEQERYTDECLFSDPVALKAERKRMKREFRAHIDICSCNDLIRIDLESYKYDSFLTLAADDIIRICSARFGR